MDAEAILDHLTGAIDAVIASTDRREGPFLFSSILDRETGRIPDEFPAPIDDGHRMHRAYPGANLMHDVDRLRAMFGLAEAAGAGTLAADAPNGPAWG